jgi:glycerol-3-phosphate dehydrogenase
MPNQQDFDLVIAGGGINGAALARQAAFQGLKVAVFEAGDFGQGASTNTSKLLHGGLRYLETYDFGLVRDAVRERAELLSKAPHLVEARRFLFPRTRLGRHARPLIKAGMTLYDLLAGGRLRLDPHGWVPPEELRSREPHFLPGEEVGGYEYSDCVMDDARLVMENLVDAAALGAEARNYHRFLGTEPAGDGALEATFLDRLTGRERVVRAGKVALALGPWTDEVLKAAYPEARPQVRLSQGIHLIADGLDSRSCFILPVPGSRRYFFVVPWKGKHLIGTTETEVGEYPPDPPMPMDKEIEELEGLVKTYFPGQSVRAVCTITGLRPLARASKGSTITLSREHEFHTLSEGVYSVVGGKYTTHRTLAREYLGYILGKGGEVRHMEERPFPGAWKDQGERESLRTRLRAYRFVDPETAAAWMRRYGMRSMELAESVAADAAMQDRLPGPRPLLLGEVHFAASREWARTPVDFYRRRTDLYFTADAGLESLAQVESVFDARAPGWRRALGPEADYREFLRRNRHVAVA